MTQNTQDMAQNTQDATQNTQDMAQNTQDATQNTQDVAQNTQKINITQEKKNNLDQRVTELEENISGYDYDLDNKDIALQAASKKVKGDKLSEEEKINLGVLENQYPAFYESANESGSEDENGKARLNIEERVQSNIEYLEKEKELDTKELNSIKKTLDNSNVISEEGTSEPALGKLVAGDRKRKAESSEDEASYPQKSTKVDSDLSDGNDKKESPSDFIDDLPVDYNPFDDVGFD